MQYRSRFVSKQAFFTYFATLWTALIAISCGDSTSPRTPPHYTLVSGDLQAGAPGALLAAPLVVKVTNAAGAPLSGQTVTFALATDAGSASGHLSSATAVSDTQGLATTQWTLGTQTTTAGIDTQRVNVLGASGSIVGTFRAIIATNPPALFTVLAGQGQQGLAGSALPDSIRVRVLTQSGAAYQGAPITWTLPVGSHDIISPNSGVTDVTGYVDAKWTLDNTPGTHLVIASTPGLPDLRIVATAQASGTSPIVVGIDYPRPSAIVGDAVTVQGTIRQSTYQIAGMTAQIGGRTITLTRTSNTNTWTGTASLTGLPLGATQITFTGTDVLGNSQTVTQTVVHDPPPQLTITTPNDSGYANPNITFTVACTSSDSRGCTTVKIVSSAQTAPLVTGTTSINSIISLASYNGHTVTLSVIGQDYFGGADTVSRTIFVSSNTYVTPVLTVPGRILDYSGTDVLYVDENSGLLKVRHETSDVTLSAPVTGVGILAGQLTPRGAIIQISSSPSLWDIDGNGAIPLVTGTLQSASLNWNYATIVPTGSQTLTLRDLTTGINTTITSPGGNITDATPDPNGDVIFAVAVSPGIYTVYHQHAGVATPIASNIEVAEPGLINPVTDGVNIAYARDYGKFGEFPDSTFLVTGEGPILLTHFTPNDPLGGINPLTSYLLNNGWTAYQHQESDGTIQVWSRSPTGDTTKVSALSKSAFVASGRIFINDGIGGSPAPGSSYPIGGALGSDGTIIMYSPSGLYASRPPYSSTILVDPYNMGRIIWRAGQFYQLVGSTVLSVTF